MEKKIIIQLKAELSDTEVHMLNNVLMRGFDGLEFPQPLFLTARALQYEADKINRGNALEGKERFTADDLLTNFPETYALRKLVITTKRLGIRSDAQVKVLRNAVEFFQKPANAKNFVDDKFSENIHTDFFDRMLRYGKQRFKEVVENQGGGHE